MWTLIFCMATLLVMWISHWTRRWRNPNCPNNGVLPPGSMGLPLIGESLHLVFPGYSLDLHPFIKTRMQRYGPIFRTSVMGKQVAISTDAEFNDYIMQQEGRLVELWYLDTFSKLFAEDSHIGVGAIHKYLRGLALNHLGAQNLKDKLLPEMEECIYKTLSAWSSQETVEVRHATSVMLLNFGAKALISYNAEKASEDLAEKYTRIVEGVMAIPLNIPGTSFYKCRKEQESVVNMLRDMLNERRRASPAPHDLTHQGDFLDKLIKGMDEENFLTEDFVVHMLFGLLLAVFETMSVTMTLAFKLLADHPSALAELKAEHEAILKKREIPNSPITWEEYKSMTFTHQVMNETLRLGNILPGLLRKAKKDIQMKGYTIPAGWTIMLVPSALHFNPNTFNNPLEFNPWRWKDLDSVVVAKNFMPFGGGTRLCVGAEYSRLFMATFFHILLTKYRWTKIRGGEIARNPLLAFGKGLHIKFYEKKN